MSAAEKLKALMAEAAEGGHIVSCQHALPQIVAVVEAAEVLALRIEEEHQNERSYRLDDALAALDEALGA